jgi:hypothetical protein
MHRKTYQKTVYMVSDTPKCIDNCADDTKRVAGPKQGTATPTL